MITLKITRWLIGFVRFSVHGGSPEKFYSLCARSGAYLWDITGAKKGGACIAARRYRALRRCAHRAGCRLRVCERHGLPFLIQRTKDHRGLWAGAVLFVIILYLLSLRVWCVQISGNSAVPTSQIEAALVSAGLSPGAPKGKIAPERLAQQMMLKFPDIRWMSINMRGCAVQVVIQEKTKKPELQNHNSVCNIKASATGQIVSMKVYAGTPMVHKGDAVIEGQLLVSAIVVDEQGGNTLKHASAEIIAETSRSYKAEIKLNCRRWEPTGKTVYRRNLDLFGARLPVTFQGKPHGNYRTGCEKADVQLFGTILPVGIYTERWDELRPIDYRLTKGQAVTLAKQETEKQAKQQLNGGKITALNAAEKWEKDNLVYTAQLTCEENIARESEIFIK